MKYHDGQEIQLGDIVNLPTPDGESRARVVMLGDTQEHLDLDAGFLDWVMRESILPATSIFVEWIGPNPFSHANPQLEPVGNYMSSTVDEDIHFECRASAQDVR
jgi:hypothetical protein